VKLILQIHS